MQALAGGPVLASCSLPALPGSLSHSCLQTCPFQVPLEAAQLKSITLRFIFFPQARCFPEAEFFRKVLMETFVSGIGRKRKNPHFDSVKTWQKFIQMWSNALT